MKKKILGLISALLVVISISTIYAGQFQTITGKFYLKDDGQYAHKEWITADIDGDSLLEWGYINDFGMLDMNVSVDGYQLDNMGRWVINGMVQHPDSPQVPQAQTQNNVINTTNNENMSSSAENKRKLYNNISAKSGVNTYETKKVCGKSWVEVIGMNGSDSYIKTSSGNYNALTFECGINAPKDDANYTLSFYIGGELVDTIDEFGSEPEKHTIYFDPNSSLMIVYNATAEEGSYLSTEAKTLYIRNAKFVNKNERNEDD